ncbi:hypothetical protein EKO27_g9143 [Xylaria grammica]|uniref:Heterokaryon incompatibility domain-containing protein n=1 Tax=Xylaria grammica TaxID=363999 RepID=A0A439CV74_9PEZI|nr:hypothetical protein EKO27_g9143 [Xylaria grammica]
MIDLAYEAARMSSYYQNSRLTIAGTYGDDTIGLPRAETPENSRPLIRLPYRARPGSIALRLRLFYLIPSDCHFNQDYEDHVSRSDLLTRGWVIQEWVLSRRILCYTPTSAYFQIWSDIVATYSQRSLTRPETDKLMGLVGIANEFGRALVHKLGLTEAKSRIWASGLWLEDIFEGLLWEQVGHLPASAPRPSPNWYDAGRIGGSGLVMGFTRMCAVREAKIGQPETATAEGTGEDWESLPIIGGHPDPDQARLVDTTKMFPVLYVRARIITILIRETFADEEERQVAAKLPGYAGSGR